MGEKGKAGGDKWVLIIGITKLAKGVLLLAAGIGVLHLFGKDVGKVAKDWVDWLNADANSRFVRELLHKADGLDSKKLSLAAWASFVYSALFLTEGIGLVLRKRWGEWVTVIITGSFLPIEIFEVCRKFSPARVILIVLNAAVVVYLIWRLKTKKKKKS